MKNRLLCIDLALELLDGGIVEPNVDYRGILRLTPSDHEEDLCDGELTFKETALTGSVHRNICRFDGKHLTLTQRTDGSLRLNFRSLKIDDEFNIDRFAFEVADEIRQALYALIEE